MVFNLENRWWLVTGLERGGVPEGVEFAHWPAVADKRVRRWCAADVPESERQLITDQSAAQRQQTLTHLVLLTKVSTLSLRRLELEYIYYVCMKKIKKLTCRPYVCHEIENYCLFTTFLFPHIHTLRTIWNYTQSSKLCSKSDVRV